MDILLILIIIKTQFTLKIYGAVDALTAPFFYLKKIVKK